MRRALLVVSLCLTSVSAQAAPPPTGDPGESVGELSARGTRRGALEFGLGGVLLATGGALVGAGALELVRAREHVEFCRLQSEIIDIDGGSGGIDPCVFDPPPLGFTAAGLAWGFSIPLFVGAGMLIERGVRVGRDARAWRARSGETSARPGPRWTLSPWWNVRGRLRSGGASLSLRF